MKSQRFGWIVVGLVVGACVANYRHHGDLGYLQDCGWVPAVGALFGAGAAAVLVGMFGSLPDDEDPREPPDDLGGAV